MNEMHMDDDDDFCFQEWAWHSADKRDKSS